MKPDKGKRRIESMCIIGGGVDCLSWPNLLAARLLYESAVEVVRATKRASVAHLQRQMGIGYNQAVELIDEMEKRGVIGPKRPGRVTREVLVKAEKK